MRGENIKYCEQDNSSLENLWAQIKESLENSSVVGISNSLIAFISSYEGAVAGYLKGAYETAKHLANKAAIVRSLSIATKAIPGVSTIIDTTLQVVDGEEIGHAIIKSTAHLAIGLAVGAIATVFPASIPAFLIASGVTVVLST